MQERRFLLVTLPADVFYGMADVTTRGPDGEEQISTLPDSRWTAYYLCFSVL